MKPVALRLGIKALANNSIHHSFPFLRRAKKMAFRFALLAALCVTQGSVFARGNDVICKNPSAEFGYSFEEAVNEVNEVRESVSMAALDSYAAGSNIEVIIACFRAQRESFIELGQRMSELVRDSARELAEDLGERADKYAELLEAPLRTIAVTMRTLPERVYNYLKDKDFNKAYEAIVEARNIVRENGRMIDEIITDMVREVPELADKTEEMARRIRAEGKKGSDAIREAFKRCVAEGGPTNAADEE